MPKSNPSHQAVHSPVRNHSSSLDLSRPSPHPAWFCTHHNRPLHRPCSIPQLFPRNARGQHPSKPTIIINASICVSTGGSRTSRCHQRRSTPAQSALPQQVASEDHPATTLPLRLSPGLLKTSPTIDSQEITKKCTKVIVSGASCGSCTAKFIKRARSEESRKFRRRQSGGEAHGSSAYVQSPTQPFAEEGGTLTGKTLGQQDQEEKGKRLQRFQIFVRGLRGTSTEIEIDGNCTVKNIKEQVESTQGVPSEQQRLIFGGRILQDHHTATESALTRAVTVNLVLRLRGGPGAEEQEDQVLMMEDNGGLGDSIRFATLNVNRDFGNKN
jgi:large subunit ribosomal protein L40e